MPDFFTEYSEIGDAILTEYGEIVIEGLTEYGKDTFSLLGLPIVQTLTATNVT